MITTLSKFAQLGQLYQQQFAESTIVDDPLILKDLERLLEPQTGRLGRLFDVTIDNSDTFRGKAEQRISLGKVQIYTFTIGSNRMSYRLIDADAVSEYAETDEGFSAVLEYAAKAAKGAKTNKAQKKLNCKPGNIQCGGKCQNGSLNCYKNMSPEEAATAKRLARKARAAAKRPQPATQFPNDNPDFAPMYAMAINKVDPDAIIVSKTQREAARLWSQSVVYEKGMPSKVQKIQDEIPSVDADEARALATWLGQGYTKMSRRIWDANRMAENTPKEEYDAIMALNVLAAKALNQQSPATVEQITREATKKGHIFDPEKPLSRWMTIDPPDGYLKKYRDAIGKELVEDNFLGTSHLEDYEMTSFSDGSNIEYRVKAKLDGTGQGRYVDHFKNLMKEGEVLYPPGARFKVVAVRDPEPLGDPPKKPIFDFNQFSEEEMDAYTEYENKKMMADLFEQEIEPLTPLEEKMKAVYDDIDQQVKAYNNTLTSYQLKASGNGNRYIIELEEV